MQHRAGLFSLIKNLTTDRLILDSRPQNQLEVGLSKWTQTMASVMPILDVVLRPENVLVASGEDLKDFYYFFQVRAERSRRNAILFDLTREEASQFKCFTLSSSSSPRFVPALATMAMGM